MSLQASLDTQSLTVSYLLQMNRGEKEGEDRAAQVTLRRQTPVRLCVLDNILSTSTFKDQRVWGFVRGSMICSSLILRWTGTLGQCVNKS